MVRGATFFCFGEAGAAVAPPVAPPVASQDLWSFLCVCLGGGLGGGIFRREKKHFTADLLNMALFSVCSFVLRPSLGEGSCS